MATPKCKAKTERKPKARPTAQGKPKAKTARRRLTRGAEDKRKGKAGGKGKRQLKAKTTRKPKATAQRKTKAAIPVRLDIGCGVETVEGWTPVDRKARASQRSAASQSSRDKEAFPLDWADGSVDVIRASHVLEHFSHRQTAEVLADWVRALRPGGTLAIAVPDFERVVHAYQNGPGNLPIEGFIMGGHVDEDDHHGAIFTLGKLRGLMKAAGLVDIGPWKSDRTDCASYPISLNLQGAKPTQERLAGLEAARPKTIYASMSMPRLSFTDNYWCAFQALLPLKIQLRRHTGAYWGQCLERCMLECIEQGADTILTLDYDTVFGPEDVAALTELMAEHPEADAICATQMNRSRPTPLMTIHDDQGNRVHQLTGEHFHPDLLKITTAHFGLTMIRVSSLRKVPHPWFRGEPNPDTGMWDNGRTDPDIWFWRRWAEAGLGIYMANHVPIGHAELMIMWPGVNAQGFYPLYQLPSEYWETGRPNGILS